MNFQYLIYYHKYALAKVHVGHACSSDLQCTGTGNAGDCRNGVCHCHLGYLQKDGICYLGKIFLYTVYIAISKQFL